MASRKSSRGGKIQPAVQTMEFIFEPSTAPRYISLSAAASILNRRFYRQGLNWAVGGITVIAAPQTSGTIEISKMPNTWVVSNAWEKGFRMWQKQQNEALEDSGTQSVKGRFNDFKVFADVAHSATATPHFVLPRDLNDDEFLAPEEWLYSQVVVPNDGGVVGNTVEYNLHMVGNDTLAGNSRGLVQAYAESRAVPQSPDPATIGPGQASVSLYADMFNVGNDDSEVLLNAELRNDELPYDQIIYPGQTNNGPTLEILDRIYLNPASTIPGKYQLAGSNVPCGLLRVDGTAVDASFKLMVHLIPGNHRGYMCESMTEM